MPSTRPTATLCGLVFADTPSGLEPVDGARVRLEIGSLRQDATTDQTGRYYLSGLYDGVSSISTSKDGYDPDTRQVSISGDVRLDIRVVRRVAYTLSVLVSEVTPTGKAPVEGALVTGPWDYPAPTDRNGLYRSAGPFIGLSKEGFEDPRVDPNGKEGDGQEGAGQEDNTQVTINGDTRLDLRLVRR